MLERDGGSRERERPLRPQVEAHAVTTRPRSLSKGSRRLLVAVVLAVAALGGVSAHYRVSPQTASGQVARWLAAPVLGYFQRGDALEAQRLRRGYWVGDTTLRGQDALASWRGVAAREAGIRLTDSSGARPVPADVPFVYESADAPYLRELVDRHALRAVIAGSPDEYQAMLRLGDWAGRLFDHGADALGRRQSYVSPVEVIRQGLSGKKFWCEIAARLTVHAATALGWQARLVTASKTGYTWDHAVAELWSNQHRKWFVLDTDFNVVYEVDGVPQSAFELCRRGLDLQRSGRLHTRAVAPPKRSLPTVDLLPFYAYVHIDLRNDWNSRHLAPGSPVGGDLSTWWTARPEFGPVLTAKTRVDGQQTFDWAVNAVSLHALGVVRERNETMVLRVGLASYSPSFRAFETSFDSGPWVASSTPEVRVPLTAGAHVLKARVATVAGFAGPEYSVAFEVARR